MRMGGTAEAGSKRKRQTDGQGNTCWNKFKAGICSV